MLVRTGLLVLAMILFVRAASAQPTSAPAAAEALYLEAEALVRGGQFAPACAKLLESQRLDPQLGTLLHLADCYERNGQTASAWATFREAAELAARRGDDRAQVALDRATALFSKLSYVTIVVPVESRVTGLVVERESEPVPPATWGTPIPLDAGRRVIRAQAPGRTAWSTEIEPSGPGSTVVTVPILAVVPALPSAPRPPEPAVSNLTTTLGWVSVGAGAFGLGLGGALAVAAGVKGSDADAICAANKACSREDIARYDRAYASAEATATAAAITVGTGIVFLATGAVFLWTGRRSASAQRRGGAVASW